MTNTLTLKSGMFQYQNAFVAFSEQQSKAARFSRDKPSFDIKVYVQLKSSLA